MIRTAEGRPRRVIHRLTTFIEEDVPALLLATIVVALTADVIGRYVFNNPLQYAGEVALIAFIWQVYLGVAAVARQGRHITIDIATGNLPPRVQAAIHLFVHLVILGVLAYLVINGLLYFATGHFTELTGTGMSKKFLMLAIPVSALLMAVYSLRDLAAGVRGLITGEFAHREHELADAVSRIDRTATPDNLRTGAIKVKTGAIRIQPGAAEGRPAKPQEKNT